MTKLRSNYAISILFSLTFALYGCGSPIANPASQIQGQDGKENIKQAPVSMKNMAAMTEVDVPTDLDFRTDRLTDQGVFRAQITSNIEPVDINQMHSWTLRLETPGGEKIEGATIIVDGGMPQHDHGFPTTPQVTSELAEGAYLVEGVRFNMTGWWQMRFKIEANGQFDQITFNLLVETGHANPTMNDDDLTKNKKLKVEHFFGNLTLPTDTGAIYGTISNETAQDERLVAAMVEGCDQVEFHQTVVEDSIVKMSVLENGQIDIPANNTLNLEPGSRHLMCVGKNKAFAVGELVPLTLDFAHTGQIKAFIEVREPGDIVIEHHNDHSQTD